MPEMCQFTTFVTLKSKKPWQWFKFNIKEFLFNYHRWQVGMSSFTIPESILSLGGVVRWCFSGSPHQLEDLVAARFFTPTLVVIRFMLYSSYLPLHLPFLLQVLPEILVSDLLAFPRSSSQTFIQPHLLTHAPLLQSLASLDSCLSFYKPQTRRFICNIGGQQ